MSLASRASRLIAALALAAALLTSCPNESAPRLYKTYDTPPAGLLTDSTPALWDQGPAIGEKVEATADRIGAMQLLGAQLIADAKGAFRGVNFSVYSQRAEKVRLLLFDDPESDKATRQLDMVRLSGSDVWNVYVEGVGLGQYYGFVAWGPNWRYVDEWYPGSIYGFQSDVDVAGNRFNPNKLLADPYCKVFNRGFDWAKGSAGTGADRASLTYAAAGKCRVVQSSYQWSEEEGKWRQGRIDDSIDGHHWNDLVLYEVHPKGFTANASSGVPHPGTFRGFGEKADYFVDLGVNAIELMPPFEKANDAGYWGYNTLGFFAPEHTYLSRNKAAEGIDEFKWMVDELHKRGIEVILDVVYNHTGEGGLWRQKIYRTGDDHPWNLDPEETASLLGFRGLDNWSYYALPPGNGREYCDYTGVGNTLRCNNGVMQRLIVDSLRYWVEEMHVDGFRFDLAPALGAKDSNAGFYPTPATNGQGGPCPTSANPSWNGIKFDALTTVLQQIANDPVFQRNNTRIIAEPWGGGGYPVGQFPGSTTRAGYGWGEWNGMFRDWWRSFVNDDTWVLNRMQDRASCGELTTGSEVLYGGNGRKPYHSVNFITCHDGMTMYDLVSYNQKVNGCSPLNPVCCTDSLSSFCQEAENSGTDDNRSRDWGMGTANENTKRQLMRNWFMAMAFSNGTPMLFGGDEWLRTQLGNNNTYTPEADNPYSWHDWGSWQAKDERWRMFDFVKNAMKFRRDHAYALAPSEYGTFKDFYWRNADGTQKTGAAWNSRTLMIHYSDRSKGPELAILINMDEGDMTFTPPPGRTWRLLFDTQAYYDTEDYLNGKKLSLRASGNATLDNPEIQSSRTDCGGTSTSSISYCVKSRTIVVMEAK